MALLALAALLELTGGLLILRDRYDVGVPFILLGAAFCAAHVVSPTRRNR